MARILFVDDDPITLKMLCRIAEIEGHHPLTAKSGGEALESAATHSPDLIVLDMMMADMDGITVIKHLQGKSETAEIPIVVLSAGFELDAEEQVQAAGAKAYLTKPLSMAALREVVLEYAT